MNVAIFSKYNHIFLNLSLQYFFSCVNITTWPKNQFSKQRQIGSQSKKRFSLFFIRLLFLFKKAMDMTAMHYEVATLKTSRIKLYKFQTSARVHTQPKIPQPCERQLLKLMGRPQCPQQLEHWMTIGSHLWCLA